MKNLLILFVLLTTAAIPEICMANEDVGIVDQYKINKINEQANKLYHEGKYDPGRAAYIRAKDIPPEGSNQKAKLHYNIGTTFYKEGNYDAAEKEFQEALSTEDTGILADVHYNLGNVNFKKGTQNEDIELLEKAVSHYQKTLEINPDELDAKHNIEVVRRLINIKREEQKNQPKCNNPKNQDNKDQQQKDQKQGQNQQGQQDQKQKENSPDKKDGEEKDQQQNPDQMDGSTAGQKEPVQPAGSKDPDKISEEEAKRLLQAIQDDEKENLKKIMKANQQKVRKEKDW